MSSDLPTRITFAPVDPNDFDELAELRIAAMRPSLERLGRFSPERARERLRNSFYPEHTQFVLLDGRKIGFYTFRPAEGALKLDHFYIHPADQSQGIGSQVMKKLIAEANEQRQPIRLGALKESDSNRFYRRHGFDKTGEDEWDTYYIRLPATDPLFRAI